MNSLSESFTIRSHETQGKTLRGASTRPEKYSALYPTRVLNSLACSHVWRDEYSAESRQSSYSLRVN